MPNAIDNEPDSVIAFYGMNPKADGTASVYRMLVDWFNELGYPPGKVAFSGPGYGRRMMEFARGDAKARRVGLGNVYSFGLISLLPMSTLPLTDYQLDAHYDAGQEHMEVVVTARSCIAKLSGDSMLPLARRLMCEVKPEYGIGYERLRRLGPAFYAIGVCQGIGLAKADYEEGLRISRWADAVRACIWRRGLLRDVYLWNFLTASQLSMNVDGVPLERWIEQNPNRGTLAPVGTMFLWAVDEQWIPSVREQLDRAGLIFDWKRHLR